MDVDESDELLAYGIEAVIPALENPGGEARVLAAQGAEQHPPRQDRSPHRCHPRFFPAGSSSSDNGRKKMCQYEWLNMVVVASTCYFYVCSLDYQDGA